ncbi:FtsK/SpoIIIE domain-containing protein [Pseudarthrobacter sp. S9]|uniref:FtsK/SpoIIIE domain-containing protein n=1 Tax=Pseudarthrobacter sp. S9 TaxID=3418421 RepID=UPI003CFBC476
MMFHCTRVRGPGSALAGDPIELAVDAPADSAGAELQAAVSRRYGTGELFVQGVPVAAMTVGVAPLVRGAVLVDGFPATTQGSGAGQPGAALLILAVHSGPGAGIVFALRRGQFRIGRSGTEVVIPDAELSREHARLDVSESAVTLVDLGSANGTRVDGRRVRQSAVTTGSLIRCGDSTMSLIFGGGSASTDNPDSRMAWAGSGVAEPLVVRGTAAPSNRAAVVLTAALPLLIGIGLALLTGMWMFLAFTAISAVSVVVPVASGRRHRRELKTAVTAALQRDKDRRRRAAPSAADLSVRGAFGASGPPPATGESAPVWLRLGLAEQTANVRLEPADPGFRPPPLGPMPLTLDPSVALTTIHGTRPAVAGLVRSFIMQLAGYPLACRTRLLLHGSPESLPLAARFLPGVTLSGNEAATAAWLAAGPGQGFDHGLLIILDAAGTADGGTAGGSAPDAAGGTAVLRAVATGHGWRVIDCSPGAGQAEGSQSAHPGIVLGERGARITAGAGETCFIPDLVPPLVFDRYCRRLGAGERAKEAPPAAIPGRCALVDVLPLSAAEISRRWARAGRAPGLPVPVGAGTSGTLQIDLQADGPHFLVAGTTGSGKSEFLRTLAAGLAASHPPDRVNLLFLDFKGGSGLGPLTGLPHCVGMLTDLGANQVERALVSLRAEVRRREELLAAARAPDLTAYESSDAQASALPHLVLVIDEFRMLVEEAPGVLSELMRIAAIGRSLGIHLIMATQRPQGALTADIRANVTSCVALRVQSDLESIDVMNSRLAAGIPLARPGRAFLVRGTEAPEEFQTATLTPAVPGPGAAAVAVHSVQDVLTRPPGRSGHGADAAAGTALTPAQAAAPLVEVTAGLWAALGGSPPRRPVADPLPAVLPYPAGDSPAAPEPPGPRLNSASATEPATQPEDGDTVRLGWVDLPEQQRIAGLSWSPAEHGHLGLVGGVAGAGDPALALAVEQLLTGDVESHLYFLDSAGSFSTAASSPRVGAVAGLDELRRAVRVLERLAQEVTLRLGAPALHERPRLVLVLSGWGAWVSAFRSGPLAWAEDLVQDIVRDGAKAGITVIVSGERELVTSRFFAAIPNRIFFPAGSTEEGRLAWPRLPALEPAPGRVAVFGTFTGIASSAGHIGQLFEAPGPAGWRRTAQAVRKSPFRVDALPLLITVAEVLARFGAAGQPAGADAPLRSPAPGSLCIGVGGDALLPFTVPLPGGSVLAVLGGPASGKGTLLAALPGLNPAGDWLAPGAGTDPEQYWSEAHASALAGTLDRTAIVLADDADLQSHETNNRLLTLNSLGWTVILTAGFGPAFHQRVPLAACARSQGRGILIRPRGLMDGDLFGVRFELEHSPPPGRAVVISDGRATPVQLASEQPVTGPVQ